MSGGWNEAEGAWDLRISRDGAESSLRSSYVVFAVGSNCTFPMQPTYEDRVSTWLPADA